MLPGKVTAMQNDLIVLEVRSAFLSADVSPRDEAGRPLEAISSEGETLFDLVHPITAADEYDVLCQSLGPCPSCTVGEST